MHGAMIPLSRGCEIRAGGYMPEIYDIYGYEKTVVHIRMHHGFLFYCKVPFLVQEMETVRESVFVSMPKMLY